MGLIQQAHLVFEKKLAQEVPVKKKTGLLSRIQAASGYDTLLSSFREYLGTIHAERAGLLGPGSENYWVLLLNTGFDLTTAKRFCPHNTFFSNLGLSADGWTTFSAPKLDSFDAFFSSHERDSLISVYIRPIEFLGTTWYLLLADSYLDAERQIIDLKAANEGLPTLIEVLSSQIIVLKALTQMSFLNQSRDYIRDHIQSAFNNGRTATMFSLSFIEVFPEFDSLQTDVDIQNVYIGIVHRIAKQAGSSNILQIMDNFDLRLVIFSSMPLDLDLYIHQLMKPLEKFFGVLRVSKIKVLAVGKAHSSTDALGFLTGVD